MLKSLFLRKSFRPFTASLTRSFAMKNSPDESLPRLIYFVNPFHQLMAKINFMLLKRRVDPTFNEKEFKCGASKAMLELTDMVRKGEIMTMQKVTTSNGYNQVSKDTVLSTNDPRLNLLRFRDQDIQMAQPLKVHIVTRDGTKTLFVDMFFALLRSLESMAMNTNGSVKLDVAKIEDSLKSKGNTDIPNCIYARRLILAEVFTRFHRDYGHEDVPDWNIEFYKVAKLKIIYPKYS